MAARSHVQDTVSQHAVATGFPAAKLEPFQSSNRVYAKNILNSFQIILKNYSSWTCFQISGGYKRRLRCIVRPQCHQSLSTSLCCQGAEESSCDTPFFCGCRVTVVPGGSRGLEHRPVPTSVSRESMRTTGAATSRAPGSPSTSAGTRRCLTSNGTQ